MMEHKSVMIKMHEINSAMLKHWDYSYCLDDFDNNPLMFNFGCNNPSFGYGFPVYDLDYQYPYDVVNAMWEFVYENFSGRS